MSAAEPAFVRAGAPTLGICFGHQLLAQALGGNVVQNPRGREIGTVDLEVVESEPEGPRALRLSFALSLDDPRLLFLADEGGLLRAVEPPAPGGTRVLPALGPRGPLDL